MSYYFNKKVSTKDFQQAIDQVSTALKEEGFGILSTINMQDALKNKLDVDFRKYTILGACNPSFAFKALQHEDKVGLLLPCHVLVEQYDSGTIEVAIIDPITMMSPLSNKDLSHLADEISIKLKKVIESLT